MQIYFAGPLFTPYERSFIAESAAKVRAAGIDVFVPHEQSLPEVVTAKAVFDKDGEGLFPANAVLALLDGPVIDDGTACEIGLFYGLKRAGAADKLGIVGLLTDSRSIPSKGRVLEGKGLNLYVQGCIEEIGTIVTTVEEAIEILLRWDSELR